MTIEQAQKDFDGLIAQNGFVITGYTRDTGISVYHRVWRNGSKKLEVRMILSGTYTLVTVKKNGKIAGDIIRDYSSPKRAFNAIRTSVQNTGFDM